MVSHFVSPLRQFISSIDPDLVRHYQIGLGIGILVITTLAVFPGEYNMYAYDILRQRTERLMYHM